MATRNASAQWNGDLQSGSGTMALGSGAFEGSYSFKSRFEDGAGTNPEELIGAAHAGCFSMALTVGLERAGYEPSTAAAPSTDASSSPMIGGSASVTIEASDNTTPAATAST